VTDPLEALISPIVPLAPDPVFVARLRRRLVDALTATPSDQESDMTELTRRDHLSVNGSRHGDVSYVTLATSDAEAARRFYGRVLGWTFGTGQIDTVGNQVETTIPQIGVWPRPSWPGWVSPGAILSWRVDDISVAAEAVRSVGGTADDPVQMPYGLQSECSDGQGLRFWLHQLPSPGEPAGSNGDREGDVSYVVLRVADLDHARRLLSTVLGWEFRPGNSGFNVEGPSPMTGISEGPPGVTMCYRVDDIFSTVERVTAAGGHAGEIESRPYGLEAFCRDDQGIEFYLHQLDD
jgi:predicted enzyme related to lactoylglutathione lyase